MATDTSLALLLLIVMLSISRVISSPLQNDDDDDDVAGFSLDEDDDDKRAVSAGHRFIGLGKRPSVDPGFRLMGLGKRPMDASMRYMGLGKRAVSPSMRYIGLGKRRVDQGMKYIGLGRRSGDDEVFGLEDDDQALGYDSLTSDKRPYSTSAAFRLDGKRRVDSGMKYIGLGKRTSARSLYDLVRSRSEELKRAWPFRRARVDPTLRMMGIGR